MRTQIRRRLTQSVTKSVFACALLAAMAGCNAWAYRSRERTCVPVLHLASFLNGTHRSSVGNSNSNEQPITTSVNRDLSFAVANIEIPVVPTEGSLGSTVRMLARLGTSEPHDSGDDQISSSDEIQSGEESELVNAVRFRDNRLNVLGLNVTMLNVHLHAHTQPRFGVGLSIKNATLTGRFAYHGNLLMLTDSRLSGHYRMSIDSIYLQLASNLTSVRQVRPAVGHSNQSVANHQSRALRTNDLRLNITNLGYITIQILDESNPSQTTPSYLLRLLQRFLQRTIKRTYHLFEATIRDTLERETRRAIDCELSRFTPLISQQQQFQHGHGLDNNNHADIGQQLNDLALIVSSELAKSQLSSVALPDFEHSQTFLGTNALIRFSNGSLAGLDHVRLNDDARVKHQDGHLFVNASLGWSDLRPHYNWTLHLGSNSSATPTGTGFVSFNINSVELDATVTRNLRPRASLVVERLTIRRLDGPRVDIGGLPGLNRIARGLVNFFVGRLKQRLSASLEPVLKNQLEHSLNRISRLQ